MLVAFHREGEGARNSLGDKIPDLVTLKGPVELLGQNCVQGIGFISTTVHLSTSDSGIECLEEEGLT